MKNALSRIFQDRRYDEAPIVGGQVSKTASPAARDSIRAPVIAGLAVILIFVVGLGIWASVAPIWGAVVAPGAVRVEGNRQTLKSREGGVVRAIHVRNGDLVRQGQLLMQLDDTVAKAQVEVLTNQYDVATIQRARFAAEVSRARSVAIPQELRARMGDPRVAATVQSELSLFNLRLSAIEGQAAILNQRFEQLQTARSGLDIQVQSIDEQVALIREELQGYRTLYERGFAPRTLILRYERQLAEIAGRRGSLVADITRNQQAAGETRLQLAQLYEQRGSEAGTGLRDADARLADIGPRLNAARESLNQTRIVSPVNGYAMNVSQFTVGGVAGSGEVLLDVVPTNTPLVIRIQIRPQDIDEVSVGQRAEVNLAAYASNRIPKIAAEVISVSADVLADPESGRTYYEADVRIPPEEMRKLPSTVRLTPGMPATVMVRTGRRTIMSYLTGPIGQILDNSMREQ